VLYQAVWLGGSDEETWYLLCSFNDQVAANCGITHHIRYLAVMVTRLNKGGPVFEKLKTLIKSGGLPNLISLSLHCYAMGFLEHDVDFGHEFWDAVKKNCPSLLHIHLDGTTSGISTTQWVNDSGILDFKVSTSISRNPE